MINPILERELKTRMRTWRTPIILMIYLLIIGLFTSLFFLVSYQNYRYSGGFNPRIVVDAYNVIIFCQFAVLLMILPAFTATSITGERERQTLDLMLCTDISPWKIIFGKIFAALSFILLLVFAAIPYMGIVLLFGGITLLDIGKVILYYLISAFTVSTIGIFCSTIFKKNITSIIMSYLIIGILTAGTGIILLIVVVVAQSSGNYQFFDNNGLELMTGILGPNPAFGLLSFMDFFDYQLQDMRNNSVTFVRNLEPWMVTSAFDVILSSVMIIISKIKLSKLR